MDGTRWPAKPLHGVIDEVVRECPWLWNMELEMWSGQYGFGRVERA
jgi:hypothetical protein